ncbi:hypothetical protein AMELA_G00221250 [Ameiurus melas]|uniref:Uncharacterized protein n=1 Tax=Ameiurus melas TaxID=219545 RepID=A0A7J5ZYE2_AMEME|nr:hypothetical protein AMELA_G00221250 [Ameiurus melas]
MEEGLMNHGFFYILWRPDACVCVALTWGKDGTRMHYGKKSRWWRKCDALGNVLMGENLGPGIHVDLHDIRQVVLILWLCGVSVDGNVVTACVL